MANVTIGGATLTSPAVGDLLPMQRPSSSVNRRITVESLGGVSLTWTAAQTFGAGVTLSSTLTANGAVTVAGLTTLNGFTTIQKTFTYPNSYPLRIVGGMTTPVDAPCVQLSVENNTDGSSGTNLYDGGAFIKLRGGLTAKRARYLMFTDHNDAPDWYTGANSGGRWILYRSGGAHRLWLEDDVSYFNSEGNAAVHINYHAADNVGKGGLRVYSGGLAASNIVWFSIQPDDVATSPDCNLTMFFNAGRTADQDIRLFFRQQNSNKFALSVGAAQTMSMYDYTTSKYVWYWNGSGLAIGHSTVVGTLAPFAIDANTNTVPNVIAIGHNTSGSETPVAGYGAALSFYAKSATVVNRNLGRLYFEWLTATDSGRASKGRVTAFYETTERTAMSWAANSSEALIGFYATAPAAKQTVTGSRGSNAALESLLTALATLGLITDSSS